MKRRHRVFALVAIASIAASSAAAETIAIAVRPMSQSEEEADLIELLLALEEGAMDTMFAQGHVVFDLELDESLELPTFQAIDSARAGGARYLVLMDASFATESRRGLFPVAANVTVVDVALETETPAGSVDPASIPGWEELPSDALALRVGEKASERALAELREVEAVW